MSSVSTLKDISTSQSAKRSSSSTKGTNGPGPLQSFKSLTQNHRFQVAPAELEGILISHPYVNEGVVCGKWDGNQSTEIPMAYVTLTKAGESCPRGVQSALEDIKEFIDGKVSPYKRLRGGVEILDEIPKTPTGKILRRLLPARLALERKPKL
jgi:4-coumarate--CoA ligase